jgi:lipopolysaccharide export system protein LptC
MKYHTIRNAFQESGIWPPSAKQGIKKMRVYQKKNPIDTQEDDELELPKLPPQYALDIYTTAATVREFADRDPTQFSDPSIKRFRRTMKDVNVQLNKGILSDIKLKADQVKEKAELKRRSTSRRSIQKGGATTSINELREKKEI